MATIQELESFKLSDAVKFHKELNPRLWEDHKLDPEVRDQLLLIAEDFVEYLGLSNLKVKDVTISGSNAAYSYTPHSDLDLHILVDFNELPNNEVYQELFTAKKTLYNDAHDITVHGVPVELYVQDTNQPVQSLGEYSIVHDKWLRFPKKRRANFDQTATKLKYEKLGDLIELALKSKDPKRVNDTIALVKRYRKSGLDKTGEFGPENLAYKAVRKQGLVQALYDLKAQLHGEKLSIEEEHKLLNKPMLTVVEIAEKHGVDRMQIAKQLDKGVKVELEHTKDKSVAREIALDHLAEDPKYYDKLASVELEEDQLAETAEENQIVNVVSNIAASQIAKVMKAKESKLLDLLDGGLNPKRKLELFGVKVKDLNVPNVNNPLLKKLFNILYIKVNSQVDFYDDPSEPRTLGGYYDGEYTVELFFPALEYVAGKRESQLKSEIASTLAHEIQHAIDDYKSDNAVYAGSNISPAKDMQGYLKLPYEVNARFQEATMDIAKFITMPKKDGSRTSQADLPDLIRYAFQKNRLNTIYEKNQKEYKRLLTRAYKFFDAEMKAPKKSTPIPQNIAKRALNWILGKPTTQITEEPLLELADKPYPYREVKKTGNSWTYHFETEDGNDYIVTVVIGPSRRRSTTLGIRYGIEIHFELEQDGHTFDTVVNTGDAVRVFSTVANILLDAVKRVKPDTITIISKADEPSRVKLYASLANRALKLLPEYEFHHRDIGTAPNGEEYVSIDLAKKGVQSIKLGGGKINEASGYIPSEKEKNDPRFKTALTVDVKPNSIKKNAKAFNWKTSRAGIPPQARADGKITEALISYTPDKKFVNEKEEVQYVATTVKDWRIRARIFETIASRNINESTNDYQTIRDRVMKSLVAFSTNKLKIGNNYIPIQINILRDSLLFYDVKGNSPAQEPAEFGTLVELSNDEAKIRINNKLYNYPIHVDSANLMMVTVFLDSAEKYDQLRMMVSLEFEQSLPPLKPTAGDTVTERLMNEWKSFLAEDEQQELFPGYNEKHRQERLNAWLGKSHAMAGKKPKVLYHATTKDFDQFRVQNQGWVSGSFFGNTQVDRTGIFLAENPKFAEEFIKNNGTGPEWKENAVIIPVYLSAQYPFSLLDDSLSPMLSDEATVEEFKEHDIDLWSIYRHFNEDKRWELFDGPEGEEFVNNLKRLGYDSAVMREEAHSHGGSEMVWVAFSPSQVKAIHNRGSFSPDDPRLMKEAVGETVTIYHGTCEGTAEHLLKNGWSPNAGPQGGNMGQTRYLYCSTHPDDALWFAQEKGCDTVLTLVDVPLSVLRVDPEDGTADTLNDELNLPHGLPGKVVVTKPIGPEHFKA